MSFSVTSRPTGKSTKRWHVKLVTQGKVEYLASRLIGYSSLVVVEERKLMEDCETLFKLGLIPGCIHLVYFP